MTPLLLASSYGRLPCAEVLCAAGADVNHKNVWGSTPLINAAFNAHAAVVRYLVLNDAMVSVKDKDGTALDGALKRLARMIRGVASSTDDKVRRKGDARRRRLGCAAPILRPLTVPFGR